MPNERELKEIRELAAKFEALKPGERDQLISEDIEQEKKRIEARPQRMPASQRMKRRMLRLSPELLEDLLKRPVPPGIFSEDVPNDLKIIGAQWESQWDGPGTILLKVESESFEPVEPGASIPGWTPTFHRQEDEHR